MNEIIFFLFGSFIFYLSYYVVGLFIYEKFYSKVKIVDFHEATLLGIFFLSILGVLINFFHALSPSINFFILLCSLILGFFLNKSNLKKIFKYSFFFIIFLIIFTFYARNPEDAGLYHLSFIAIINESKIDFGLSNFHSRFGHISIIQYLSALSFVPFISKYVIISQNNFIYCLISTILIKKIHMLRDGFELKLHLVWRRRAEILLFLIKIMPVLKYY